MKPKCEKYESLFVFGTEEELAKHLEICEDCQQEHFKAQKIQNLVKEASSYYKNKKNRKNIIKSNLVKIAAGFTILFLTYFSASQLFINDKLNEYDLSYLEKESVISEMGLPTDEYGLLMVY